MLIIESIYNSKRLRLTSASSLAICLAVATDTALAPHSLTSLALPSLLTRPFDVEDVS